MLMCSLQQPLLQTALIIPLPATMKLTQPLQITQLLQVNKSVYFTNIMQRDTLSN